MILPPLPAPDADPWSIDPFAYPGLETVDALRPARAPYRNENPDAPALVLIPGLTMDSRDYIRQLPLGAVADIHTLQANNNAVDGEESFGHFARHVEEYILAQKLEERPGGFVIGGSSMGGAISLAICARGRVNPRGLVLIGSFANCMHLPFYQRFFAPLSWYLPLDFAKHSLRVFSRFVRNSRGALGQDLRFMWSRHLHHTHGYYGRAIMALTRQNQIPQIQKFTLPTLVIHGTNDWVLPYSAGVEMSKAIPGARLVTIDGAGHILFYTHANAVNSAMAEFLDTLTTKRADNVNER